MGTNQVIRWGEVVGQDILSRDLSVQQQAGKDLTDVTVLHSVVSPPVRGTRASPCSALPTDVSCAQDQPTAWPYQIAPWMGKPCSRIHGCSHWCISSSHGSASRTQSRQIGRAHV